MHRLTPWTLIVSLVFLLPAAASAQQWGDLSGTFVFDGSAPTPTPATISKDQDFCGKFKLVDESLVVNPENNGIQNVVIYLYVKRGDKAPEAHPDYAKTAGDTVQLDNKQCRFEPHIVTLRTSQKLLVGNPDPKGHNTNIATLSNAPQNVLIPAGGELNLQFKAEERLPVRVACNIHPWMSGYLVIKETPYMAVSDKDGKFTIKNLPVGKWTFQFWQEAAGYLDEVEVDGKPTKWTRGRVEIEIKPGENDLGEIKVPPATFE
jgi:hypothetical protein